VHQRAQLGDLVFTEAGSMIHATGRLSGERASGTQFSRNSARRSIRHAVGPIRRA
jgi:hypothetical protein